MKKIVILIPVFNDWEPVTQLIKEIRNVTHSLTEIDFNFVLINDCSEESFQNYQFPQEEILIINLIRNSGHQKSIAIGLSYIVQEKFDFVIVMDSDGEDKPEDIIRLLQKSEQNNNDSIIFARRTKRKEGLIFRKFYWLYKVIFKILTGKEINFGNFSLLPYKYAERVVHLSEIWNHYAGGILKSRFPIQTVLAEKGKRLAGKSKMNFTALVMHGLSAISVYLDTVVIRLIFLCISLILLSIIALLAILYIRFFTTLAIPGWATNTSLAIMIIVIQAFFLCFFAVFSSISQKTSTQIIPALEYKSFIFNTCKIGESTGKR